MFVNTTTHLVAFFMQTIKEMFCNILKGSFRFFRVSRVYIGNEYWSSVVNVLHFDHTC